MTKSVKRLISGLLGITIAIAVVFCSLAVFNRQEKDRSLETVQPRADIGIPIGTEAELIAWIKTANAPDAYLTDNIAYTNANLARTENVVAGTLDGNGYTITVGEIGQTKALGSSGHDVQGLLAGRLRGTIKDLHMVVNSNIQMDISKDASWNHRSIFVGLMVGLVDGAGAITNCTFDLNSTFNIYKDVVASWSGVRDTSYFAGGMVGGLWSDTTMTGCTINFNGKIDMDATKSVRGHAARGYVAGAVSKIHGGKMYNTILNVKDGAELYCDAVNAQFVSAFVNVTQPNVGTVLSGVIINDAHKLTNKLKAWSDTSGQPYTNAGEYIAISNYDAGEVTVENIYTTTNIDEIHCNSTSASGSPHDHDYKVIGGSNTNPLAYTLYEGANLQFQAGDTKNIYITQSTLADDECMWSLDAVSGGDSIKVYDKYNSKTKTTMLPMRNATAAAEKYTYTTGRIVRNAKVGFSTTNMVYGANEDINDILLSYIYRGTAESVNKGFTCTLSSKLEKNANGYYNAGTYTITAVPNGIAIDDIKTKFELTALDTAKVKFVVAPKNVTISLDDAYHNIYDTRVKVEGLCKDEALTFSDYSGIGFKGTVKMPESYLSINKNLEFKKSSITSKNYNLDMVMSFKIDPLVVKMDGTIAITPGQIMIGNTVIYDDVKSTLTFNSNADKIITLEAVTNVYGMTYTGFSGAVVEGTIESTNSKIKAKLKIDGDVKEIKLIGSVVGKTIEVKGEGSPKITYNGSEYTSTATIPLGAAFTLSVNVPQNKDFLGWQVDNQFISGETSFVAYVQNIAKTTYTAVFADKEVGKTEVSINDMFGNKALTFYTTSTDKDAICEEAFQNYRSSFNNSAYNKLASFEVVSNTNNHFVLRPTYLPSSETVYVKINGKFALKKINEPIQLVAGQYVINNTPILLVNGTTLYAIDGLKIDKVENVNDYAGELVDNALVGEYNSDKGYVNMTITTNSNLTFKINANSIVKLVVNDGDTPMYVATIKFTRINDNIAQAIVKVPLEVFAQLAVPNITATVDGTAISGSVRLAV